MQVSDYTFLGTTKSLCPHCRRLVEAKIVVRDRRVYFRKRCPEHGLVEDFVCSDVAYWDQQQHSQPARVPRKYGVEPDKGCPYDCGVCTEHEQHTCIALVEVTSNCNLKCPTCFAESGPGGQHVSFETYTGMVDRLIELEGAADVLQISGGEPTLHPDIVKMARYAYEQPIQVVMINTNGVRLAKDRRLAAELAEMRDRLEVYLQFDGFDPGTHTALRGEELLDLKLRALDVLAAHGIRCTLVCTVDGPVNLHEIGAVLKFGLSRKAVRGVSYQLASYCGRHATPENLEKRATMPDLVKGLVAQTDGMLAETDFLPLPCAHPNCHMMSYLYRGGDDVVPINRIIDVTKHMDLIANSIVYTPARAKHLIAKYLESAGGCGCGPGGCGPADPGLDEFVVKALAEKLTGEDVFRVTLTSFLDVHNFDTRAAMKCCLAHVLPSGHVVPFCTYNTLYRDGHVPLPPLSNKRHAGHARPRPHAEALGARIALGLVE
jgi:7,8-dihydro-6-hydroxymethylpterin dimethyltransferase